MSSIAVYFIDGFYMHLMPQMEAPVCPPRQSDVFSLVFEDDDEYESNHVSLGEKANRAFRSIHLSAA
jgi:hypothetical protein